MEHNFWEISYISKAGEHLERFVRAGENTTKHYVWTAFGGRDDVLVIKLVSEVEEEPKEFILL